VVEPPDKLVYTWTFQLPKPEETLVTVEFRSLGDETEVLVTHEHSSKDMGPSAIAGWNASLDGLASLLS